MPTYDEIREDVRVRHHRAMKNCWIAHVKHLNGLPVRMANNRYSPDSRVYPCPDKERLWIEESMRRLGMLN